MSNYPPGFSKQDEIEKGIIKENIQCSNCHLIVEPLECDDNIDRCPECGRPVDDREPSDYLPEPDVE